MKNKGYSTIPRILFESITFLARVLPVRSAPTFIELLIGAMLTQAGLVTEAWLAINPLRSWSAYYKWLQQGIKVMACPGRATGKIGCYIVSATYLFFNL